VRRAVEATYTGEDIGDLSSIENRDALDDIENAR
jgi:acetyl-CoA synthetase